MIDWKRAGAVIRDARKKQGLTQTDLAKQLDVSTAAISNWERGVDLSIERLLEVAAILGIRGAPALIGIETPENWTERSKNDTISDLANLKGRVVPRYSFDQVLSRNEEAPNFTDEVRSHFPCSVNSFALLINDRANAPDFLPGDSVIIDPDLSAEPQDMVFAYVGDPRQPVFREVAVVATQPSMQYLLRPKNAAFPEYPIGPGHPGEIIGVMSEHTRPRR